MEAAAGSDKSEGEGQRSVYRHSRKQEWGLAVIAWERGDKRAYQFENGDERVFVERFWGLFEEVSPDDEQASEMLAKLAKRNLTKNAKDAARKDVPSPDEQLAVFLKLYPDSFQGDPWTNEHRGQGAPRRLKHHRKQAIDLAREELAVEKLDELLGASDFDAVHKACIRVLDRTDLVTRAQVDPLRKMENAGFFARAIRELLYGDATYSARFDGYLRAVAATSRKAASWNLCTCLSTLVHPNQHFAVRPSVVSTEAKILAPGFKLPSVPSASSYARCLELARTVFGQLEKAGHEPRDLIDVYDFMWVTLRPAAATILHEVRAEAEANEDTLAQTTPVKPPEPAPAAETSEG